MENGSKTEINLQAGLDVQTSDMLVPVQGNTWQHNWQKYQGKFLPNSVRFEKNGWAAGWCVYDFKYNGNDVDVISTDIRNPLKPKHIGRIDGSKEFQLIKQQWNSTVEVENFWWVDDTHILVLDRYNFILKRKKNELDDWNGDQWEDIYRIDRHGILHEPAMVYFCANTFNTADSAVFVLLQPMNDTTISVDIFDVRQSMTHKGRVFFQIRKHQLGGLLNDISKSDNYAYLNTYNEINAAQVINQAEFSNTQTDGRLIIGCHMNKNFDQWSAVFNLTTLVCENCVQGYGYVGLNGDLTGGQIPSDNDFFNENIGFCNTVRPLDFIPKPVPALNADANYKITNTGQINTININGLSSVVVGTTERQWFIKKEVRGIVSHLSYAGNGSFTKQVIPITNKYDACYESPSFKYEVLGQPGIQAYLLGNIVGEGSKAKPILNALFFFAGTPFIFVYAPRHTTLVYLQQTVGQYAYVHYNSTESMPQKYEMEPENTAGINFSMIAKNKEHTAEPVLSDEFTFDKQIVEQVGSINTNPTENLGLFLFIAFASNIPQMVNDLSVNATTKQTSVADIGKKYLQNSLENLQEFAVSSVYSQSRDIGLNSKVVAIKSLDMFYSTSDKQMVHAGPGFVEHQFVADCIAQSATSCQIEGYTDQVSVFLKELTTAEQWLLDKATKLVFNFLEETLKMSAQTWEVAMGTGANVQASINAAALAFEQATEKIVEARLTAMEYVNSMLEVFEKKGITCERVSSVARHSLDNEGKHRYGEKNEIFMYPCFGIPNGGIEYSDEEVFAVTKESRWELTLCTQKENTFPAVPIIPNPIGSIAFATMFNAAPTVYTNAEGSVPYFTASCHGEVTPRPLPADMAVIEGVERLLPGQPFKNENIGMDYPAFAPSMQHDYIIDKRWELSQCCTYGTQQWVTCKDTKLITGKSSNMRVHDSFCGIASTYTAVEVKRGLSKAYMRPWAITPSTLAFNCTGLNSILDEKLYHAFDGISFRIVEWVGNAGMGKNLQTFLYSFQVNDRFKRSNIFSPNELLGSFASEPAQAVETIDRLHTIVTVATKEKGMEGGTIGEDKDGVRWSIPIFTEPVTTLPAAVKTLAAMPLRVFDGVTSLTTTLQNANNAYKAPVSMDFTIGKQAYRQTEEYICSLETDQYGAVITKDLVPSLGLKFIGATPTTAYFYSKATRCYYVFNGTSLSKMDMLERFRDVQRGYWDFVNQEVVMPCLMTYKRLNAEIEDKDTETDNVIVPVLSQSRVSGEVPPPITTIFNDRSWYKAVSLPSGFAYQGPNRVIINRSVFVEYMLETLKDNLGKWKKMDREKYVTKREYREKYSNILRDVEGVEGWTHNPFLLVTSALGDSENTDNLFEWEITFCWPVEMDLIYGTDNYAVVNITAETMTPGGKVMSRPTHVFLTKELFTRHEAYGYYSFRYQSKNGAGNRERLHIWSDQYIAISSIYCERKVITERRTEQLTQQLEIKHLKEL